MTNESVAQAYHRRCIGKPCRVIESGGKPYLIRIFVGYFEGTTTYLHRFVSADAERWLHDHPFEAQSSVICGGYTEERLVVLSHKGPITAMFSRGPGEYFRVSSDTFHRIVSVHQDTWTVFNHGPHLEKGWGFLEWIADDSGNHLMLYRQPFAETNGDHWWQDPGCLRYPPAGIEEGAEK